MPTQLMVARNTCDDGTDRVERIEHALLVRRGPAHKAEREQQHGPQNVELLFDRERPVALNRRRHILHGQIVDGVGCENPVRDVDRAGVDLPQRLLPQSSGAGTRR